MNGGLHVLAGPPRFCETDSKSAIRVELPQSFHLRVWLPAPPSSFFHLLTPNEACLKSPRAYDAGHVTRPGRSRIVAARSFESLPDALRKSARAFAPCPAQRRIVNRPSATPGICRIDQLHKHTHGFFVRLTRRGKIYPAFFADKMHGGRAKAFAAAQAHYLKLREKLGMPRRRSRRWNSQIVRRMGRSGIFGVQRTIDRRTRPWRKYWRASWSPELGKVRRKQFSIRKHGEAKARQLAIRARRAGLRSIK